MIKSFSGSPCKTSLRTSKTLIVKLGGSRPQNVTFLTLFDQIGNCVANTCDPIGTWYFVLLLTKVCQLGCALHVSGDQVCQLVPRQGRAGRAPSPAACEPTGTSWTLSTLRLGDTWHTLVTNNPKDLCVTHSVNTVKTKV